MYAHLNHFGMHWKKLQSKQTIYQWTHLFMYSKNSLFSVCAANILWVMGAYVQCSRNKVYCRGFYIETAMFFVHMEKYKESTIP